MADSYFPSTSLLIHADGTNGSTTFTDTSPAANTVTPTGVTVSTSQSKWGGASAIFNGTSSYLSVPNSSAFNFGSGDFTIECWVRMVGLGSGVALFGQRDNYNLNFGFTVNIVSATGYLYLEYTTDGITGTVVAATANPIPLNVWTHVAISRVGGFLYFFIDGVSSRGETANSVNIFNSTAPLLIGGKMYNGGINSVVNGYIDDVRITKGVGRYAAGFTPPTEAFSDFGPSTAFLTCPSPTLWAGIAPPTCIVDVTAPSPTCIGFGGGSSFLMAPSGVVASASGALFNLSPPLPQILSTGHNSSGEQAAFLTAPSPTLSITTGANSSSTAPSPTLSATGTVTTLATAALTSPLPTLVAAGTVSGTGNATLRAPIATLVGYSGAVCSITLTGSPTLSATGTTGSIGGAALTCPLFELTASATAQAHGSANLLAPSPEMGRTAQAWLTAPGAQLTAIGNAVVTATYEAYAINLKHTPVPGVIPTDETTHYTNFPFTHVVRHQNSYYGANSTGLYLLEGTTDDTVPIPWAVKTAMTDFKSPNLKTVASAYFSGRFGPASSITLSAGEKAPVAYSFSTPRGALAQNHRQAFGRGLKARYYALAASGTGACEIDAIELDVHNLTRRI